ncbi:hypothetical protein E5288_WYG014224 [Bos mutus]|uniref:Uncharacterized protein n=1 Tax=Bos mutus TaxID=72004 RepID=A0A6B0R210_9CETA|nr:hypothetical protein [Bos mutus]
MSLHGASFAFCQKLPIANPVKLFSFHSSSHSLTQPDVLKNEAFDLSVIQPSQSCNTNSCIAHCIKANLRPPSFETHKEHFPLKIPNLCDSTTCLFYDVVNVW